MQYYVQAEIIRHMRSGRKKVRLFLRDEQETETVVFADESHLFSVDDIYNNTTIYGFSLVQLADTAEALRRANITPEVLALLTDNLAATNMLAEELANRKLQSALQEMADRYKTGGGANAREHCEQEK